MIATLLFGASTFFLTRFFYTYYVKQTHDENAYANLALAIALGSFAVIFKASQDNEKESETTPTQYGGIILNPSEVEATCHCEPICRIACFGRGAIGALSKEQIKKYCPYKYEQLKQLLEKRGVNLEETPKLELPQGIKQ